MILFVDDDLGMGGICTTMRMLLTLSLYENDTLHSRYALGNPFLMVESEMQRT